MPTETSGTTEGAFYRLSVGFSTVRQQTPLMATVTVGAVSTWAATAIKANTAAVEAACLRFLPPQISLYRQTVTTIGIGPSSSNGATMKAATDTKKFTTENLNDYPLRNDLKT